ncbi:unnamed protein product [Rotaria magnacalcarata]|uniref:DUF4590 domain-containing protein n=1 Tax=Rotaria magnacalcarata TaxID=392030 RepID=A0A817AMV4_9BILA|nr:unnamed protein product [Rotaria magnacalcarata]CAF1607873.1 unnamed protein product [Rotaria magnacalcarata]CAF2137360.1 unnamed protein product [Rotaria magnacalcarata]CAF2151639.1 unnamed protein product [Rotaria magnacalcarata]CAF2274224.1 unnamed protein product [Rotaria magnacalcarata]
MSDPLTYDSFQDPHLQNYFQNKNILKHLRKTGLINRYNEVIPYKEYQATVNQRSRQEHIRALLSHGVVQRVIDLERSRQANIRNQFEATAKRILVENIKESKQPYRQLPSKDFHLLNRPKTSFSNTTFQIYQQQIKAVNENKKSPTRLSPRTSISTRAKTTKVIKSNVNLKNHSQITMIYLGSQTHIDYDQSLRQQNSSEIIVMQQHCGGENLILFKKNLQQNEKFTFESRRHFAYPFALSLYVNGLIDCRISVCCEYKHKIGLPLGGKRASFAILNVQGGKPCQTCRFNEYMSNSSLSKHKTYDKSSITTDKSKNEPIYEINPERLLCTPTPCDERENETTNSNENDEYRHAEQIYENLLMKINDNRNWKENSRFQWQLANICKEGLGDYDRALDHYLISLETLCQYISPLDLKLRNLYLSIGHIFLLQGKLKNHLAIDYFQRVLNIDYSTNNKISKTYLINDHNYLGLLYQSEENFSQALFHFKKALKYILLIKSKENFNSIPISNSNENSNENDYLINRTIYDRKALESLSINNLANISEIHFNLAITYQNLGQKQNAFKHTEKALQLSTDDQKKFNIYQNYFHKLQQI